MTLDNLKTLHNLRMYRIQVLEIRPKLKPERNSVVAAPLLCVLMMRIKLRYLRRNCIVLMS